MSDNIEYWKEYVDINIEWKSITSNELIERMKDKSYWDHYQQLRDNFNQYKKTWGKEPDDEINEIYIKDGNKVTYEVIDEQLGNFKGVIADFGCGKNELAKLRKNTVHGFDFYAVDDSVTACSITNVPLKNESVHAVIISLALCTSDYHLVLEEAYRVLKPKGLLKIVLYFNSKIIKGVINKHLPDIGFKVRKTTQNNNLIFIDSYKM